MSSPLALDPAAQISTLEFGTECQPMLVADSALPEPDRVVAIAARHRFARHGEFYPGVRAPVSEAIAMPLVAPIMDWLRDTFGLARVPRFFECYLSIVTQPAAALAPIQRLPHFDGVEPDRLAVLLYLDRQERGGTAFYRQRTTGFESVDAKRLATYRQALEQEVERHGLPDPNYIAGDTSIFARTHTQAGTYNSMIVYRGNTLHCADLATDFVPDPAPETGRLTLNLFLR